MSTEPPASSPEPTPLTRRKRSPLIVIFAALVVIGIAAYGYWRFIYYPSTPAYTVEQIIEAGRARNYGRVYDLVKLTGPLKALVRSPDELKGYAERYPGLIPDVRDYEIVSSAIKGDEATVKTQVTASQGGRTTQNEINFELVRQEGIWRLDGEWLFQEAVRHGLGGALLGGAQE